LQVNREGNLEPKYCNNLAAGIRCGRILTIVRKVTTN